MALLDLLRNSALTSPAGRCHRVPHRRLLGTKTTTKPNACAFPQAWWRRVASAPSQPSGSVQVEGAVAI